MIKKMLSLFQGLGNLPGLAWIIVIVAIGITAIILFKVGIKPASLFGIGSLVVATILILALVSNAFTMGSVNQFCFGIYSDGSYKLLSSS